MKAIVRDMVRLLDKKYKGGDWDNGRKRPDPMDSLVRTILSQNTTDENRDRGYDEMQKRFPTWESVMNAKPEALKDAIRIAGLANQKGPSIQNFLKWLMKEKEELDISFLGDLPVDSAIELLTSMFGRSLFVRMDLQLSITASRPIRWCQPGWMQLTTVERAHNVSIVS